ncbi:MAG TPA: VCBS repeat-containing protein [Candidatus Cryosericum sp.]|nr:VCBS repeat-containing protein [Candidatus Cryosericum sp.]
MRARGRVLGWLLAALLVSAGGPASAQSVVSQNERDHLNRIDHDRWPGELYLDEFQPVLKRLTTSPEKASEQRALLRDEFLGVAPKHRPAATRAREGGLRVERFRYEDVAPSPPGAFLEQMGRYAAEFERVEQREIHVRRVEVRKNHGSEGRPVVDVDFETFLAGTEGGLRRSDRAAWRAAMERSEQGSWQARSLTLLTLEIARSERVFTDVTGLLPDSYRMTDPKTNKYTDFPANNGITLADWDGDGDLDINLFRPYLPGLFYENDGTGRFRERAPKGLEERGDRIESMSGTAYFFDADNDGDLDFIRLQNRSPVRFYRNEEGTYRDASREAGFARLPGDWWIGAAFADYDRDGWVDLYLLRYADRDGRASYFDSPGHPSFLMHNTGQGRFVVTNEESGMSAGNRRISWAAAWGDYNADGFPDLYVANDFGPNSLYTNHGDGTFSEDARRLGVDDRGNGMGASWADYDNDGVLDLYVSNMHSFAGERITRSLGDPLTPAQAALARRFSKGNSLFKVRPDGTFQEMTPQVAVAEAGWAWGHLFFDYDNDGDQDLYVVNGYFSNIKNTDT